jgi:hypothetical protein
MRTIRTMAACKSAVHDLIVTGALGRPCRQIAADAEQSSARGNQHRADIVTLTEFRHAKAELAAEVAVDRVAAVRLVENDMREATFDRALEARGCDCQPHGVSPNLRPTGLLFPCAWTPE